MNVIIGDLEKDQELEKDINLKEKYQISFHDMKSSMEFEKMPVDRLLAVFETLDTNKDGKIDIEEARVIINTLNSEDIQITPQQLALVVALFSKKQEMESLTDIAKDLSQFEDHKKSEDHKKPESS